jgi:hypothetical protein
MQVDEGTMEVVWRCGCEWCVVLVVVVVVLGEVRDGPFW